jgi:putative hydrolase
MALIEGHAEHVMDAAPSGRDGGVARLRDRLEARRASQNGLGDVIARLLGFDLKLRQYRLGKAFCDAVVDVNGVEGLNEAWRGPASLPTLAELERPEAWLARVPA